MMIRKIFKAIRNPRLILIYLLGFKVFRKIPDSLYLKIEYQLVMGKKLDLKKPQTFNEKLQWLKINDRKSQYTHFVDKFEVRKYIAEEIGEEYLIPLLGVYDNFDEIDFEALPDQFVLKPTHTSGNVYVCKDKSQINYDELKREIGSWLKRQYYWVHREWPYQNVKPRIICEKYMVDESSEGLKDYKFLCFNGEVKCSFICLNRHSKAGLSMDFYDMNWNILPFERRYPNSGTLIPKPITFDKMVNYAEKLSRGMFFVRVDFYEVDGKLYFGELTLYPGAGLEEFTPESYDELLGSWIKLPINN